MVDYEFIRLAFEHLKYLQYFQFDFNQNANDTLCFAGIQRTSNRNSRFKLIFKDYDQNLELSLIQIFDILNKELINFKNKFSSN